MISSNIILTFDKIFTHLFLKLFIFLIDGLKGIQVLNGRYGPYVTNKEKNARVPKDRDPKSLTLEECIELLAKAPMRGKKKAKKKAKKKTKTPAKKKTKKKTKKKKTKK